MAKRFIDTEIWNKEWYQSLEIKHKLLVKYIFENCDCAGVWDCNFRMVSFILGVNLTIEDVNHINSFKEQFILLENNKIYVKDFVKFQYGKLSYNCKPHIPVIKLLEKYNLDYETLDEDNLTIKQLRKRLTESAKKNIYIRDKYECQYCGSKEDLEIDHIIPLSKGGNNEPDNLITSCHKCNALKGDKTLEEFITNNKYNIKFLDRVSKILDTLKEKEKEQEQYKEKEKEKEIILTEEQTLYGEYNNVCLTKKQYGKLLSMCASEKLLNELMNSFSVNIEVGKERPYIADLPNAHYERLKSYYSYRMKNPDSFREPEKATDVWEKLSEKYKEMTI
jgi:hypothetical protein